MRNQPKHPDAPVLQFSAAFFGEGATGAWCNGSTADFESVDLGSTPGAPAYLNSLKTSVSIDEPPPDPIFQVGLWLRMPAGSHCRRILPVQGRTVC